MLPIALLHFFQGLQNSHSDGSIDVRPSGLGLSSEAVHLTHSKKTVFAIALGSRQSEHGRPGTPLAIEKPGYEQQGQKDVSFFRRTLPASKMAFLLVGL